MFRYGQTEGDGEHAVRPGFEGKRMRSIVTDKVNSEVNYAVKARYRVLYLKVFFVVFIVVTGVISNMIMNYKRQVVKNRLIRVSVDLGFQVDQAVFCLIEFIRILVFQSIFWHILLRFVRYINLKYVYEHEQTLVKYLSAYQLFNNSVAMLIIGWDSLVSDYAANIASDGIMVKIDQNCANSDCGLEATHFLATYWVAELIWQIVVNYLARTVIGLFRKIKVRWNDKIKSGKVLKSLRKSFESKNADGRKDLSSIRYTKEILAKLN